MSTQSYLAISWRNLPSKTVIQREVIQVPLDVNIRGYWSKETADTRAKTKVMLEQITEGDIPMRTNTNLTEYTICPLCLAHSISRARADYANP